MGGTITWLWRDEARCTPWMAYQFDRLNADLQRRFNVRLYGTSGVRLDYEQEYIFRLRYRIASEVRGRKVYDTRIWNGVRWYRIDPTGTVAVPKTSNHEIQGQDGAFDLRDTGSDPGITDRNSERGRWFRAHCHEYGMQAEGDNFREGWHFKVLGIFRTPPVTPAGIPGDRPLPPKEIRVKTYRIEDAKARKAGRTLNPGEHFYAHRDPAVANDKAENIVGGIGPYQFTGHVYAEGMPGDALELTLVWANGAKRSPHYVERFEFDRDGLIRRSVPFQRAVTAGDRVFAQLRADLDNRAHARVTVLDVDSYLFTVA